MKTTFTLRAAGPSEAAALARIHRAGRDAIPLTNALHSFEDVTAYHAGLIERIDVRVAVSADDHPIGYAARDEKVLAQLYIDPAYFRAGAGRALLRAMLKESPLEFWCFAHNARGLAFYRSFGAIEIGRELGPENEEGLPALQLRIDQTAL